MVRRRIGLGAVATALVVVLLPAAPAVAAEHRFTDPVGETASRSDIRWVRVANSRDQNRIRVRVGMSRVVYGVEWTTYLNTKLSDPGPEWKMSGYADSEWVLYRVDSWRDDGRQRNCPGSASYSQSSARPIASWTSSRSCLGIRGKARVSVRLKDVGHGIDWAPTAREFFPGVRAR